MEGDLTTKLHRKQSEIMSNGESKTCYKEQKKRFERKYQWGYGLKQGLDLSGEFIKGISELPSCCTNPDEEQSEIQQFFSGCDVLITGATGFVGKILIEKLLVSCPKIGNIYVIIREKKGKTFEERFDALFKEEAFRRLHKLVPHFRSKIWAIKGDCSIPRLGLSDQDYTMLSQHVSVIFHGAATVKFDEAIQIAANINVRGVYEIIKFARDCKSLKSIMHVSTSYTNCTLTNHDITEDFYPPAYDYKRLLSLIEEESDDTLQKMTKSLIKPWPNTYAFTKQVGEDVVRREGQGMPIGIFRPAIVVASYKEPIRGWTDNIYGPTGVIIGAGTGVLRVLQTDKDNSANIVPVDMVVNGLIAAAYRVAENFKKEKRSIEIYNYVSSARNSISWGEFSYWNSIYGNYWPTVVAIWYFSFIQVKSRFIYKILHFWLHTLPSCLMDSVLVLLRKKPRMMKVYQKISKFNEVLSYFSTNSWKFSDDNVVKLWNSLSAKDQEIFQFDIAELDWDYHTQAHVLGLRVYLVKDDIETLPTARRKWKRLQILHRSVLAILIVAASSMMVSLFKMIRHL